MNDQIARIRALQRPGEVHRDAYVAPDVFDMEMKHLFRNAWVYVGHASQIPGKGDYYATQVADQPVLMVRHTDNSVRVLYNRCPHKGTQVVIDTQGNTGKFFRCPYHAWSFKTDGSLLAVPLKKGYQDTEFKSSCAAKGMTPVPHVREYREFIFARINDQGPSFEDFFGDSLSSLDNMIDRSPAGRLEVVGSPLRYAHNCNWKMLVENQTDTCHPMVAHESSAGTVKDIWERQEEGTKKPMVVELALPFMSSYEFFEGMGIRIWDNGHGHTGVHHSIHSDYSDIPGYNDQMQAAYGKDRAAEILNENRHNTVYFPNLMIKGPIQTLRLFKPIAADKTLVESWIFRLVDAPDKLLERTAMYNRIINAPTSIVGHDDLEMYERAQSGLASDGMEWVNIQRLYEEGEGDEPEQIYNGTTEAQMRNQFRAWEKFMLMSMEKEGTS
ncbi:MAG: aromatic ring-hydroxylating dioxygenase subunit alpha [Rhodobacteraceae bacterium]|nr:aromatic ring-hydroxylating dioxygenase subunit alpha [Paracoccaceae bacterium]